MENWPTIYTIFNTHKKEGTTTTPIPTLSLLDVTYMYLELHILCINVANHTPFGLCHLISLNPCLWQYQSPSGTASRCMQKVWYLSAPKQKLNCSFQTTSMSRCASKLLQNPFDNASFLRKNTVVFRATRFAWNSKSSPSFAQSWGAKLKSQWQVSTWHTLILLKSIKYFTSFEYPPPSPLKKKQDKTHTNTLEEPTLDLDKFSGPLVFHLWMTHAPLRGSSSTVRSFTVYPSQRSTLDHNDHTTASHRHLRRCHTPAVQWIKQRNQLKCSWRSLVFFFLN